MSSQFIQRLFNAVLVLALLALGACSSKTNNENLSSGLVATFGDEEIVSTRQQDLGTVVVLVKLKSPPLLSQLENRQIDKELKAEIDKEQAEALQEMAKISPDIKLVFRYQLVINALAVSAPSKFIEQLQKLSAVSHAELSQKFDRPQVKVTEIPEKSTAAEDFSIRNSVKFIGGEAMHALGFSGQGVKVGIIDTGIDYNHEDLSFNVWRLHPLDAWWSRNCGCFQICRSEKNHILIPEQKSGRWYRLGGNRVRLCSCFACETNSTS